MPRRQNPARLRAAIAQQAARLMLHEGVGQYFDAKTIAARRVLGCASSRHGPATHMPSNGEIQEALRRLVELCEGPDRTRRLFAMRVVALDVLEALEPWHPRLIGSVATGHARRGSDIDIHVFADEPTALQQHLDGLGWRWEAEWVSIRHGGAFHDFLHLHLEREFEVELSVLPVGERRVRPRSSTDGKPIDRMSARRLRQRLKVEHAEPWQDFEQTGELDLSGLDGPLPGAFDGLLS